MIHTESQRPVLWWGVARHRRGRLGASRQDPGTIARDHGAAAEIRVPELHRWRGTGPGPASVDRGRPADGGARRRRARLEMRGSSSPLPSGANPGARRCTDRSLDAGALGRLRGFRAGAAARSAGEHRRSSSPTRRAAQCSIRGVAKRKPANCGPSRAMTDHGVAPIRRLSPTPMLRDAAPSTQRRCSPASPACCRSMAMRGTTLWPASNRTGKPMPSDPAVRSCSTISTSSAVDLRLRDGE